ncbi:MAG TPA: gliding motility-associated C-terminal domain-containing protein, partial [Chitinophagaceae bacterium]|nr:gliding motility-associated C-terminal domain-containing protein [Chitinophagaceae bacterium]
QYTIAGVYPISLKVETAAGCIDSANLKTPVTLAYSPQVAIVGDSTICINERLLHTGIFMNHDTVGVTWSWVFPNGRVASVQKPPIQQYNVAGNFQIKTIASSTNGCADTVIKNIVVNPLPTVTMPTVITTNVGVPVTLPAKYNDKMAQYAWTLLPSLSCTNCPQPLASPRFNTQYRVSFVDSNGCKNEGQIKVLVVCQGVTVFVPNTFSPNGDGSNDIFYVRGKGLDRVKLFRVFNRWGEVVFEDKDFDVNNPQHGWNGKFKGQKPHPDVYVYQLDVYCSNGELMIFSGNVALIQ